MSAIARRERLIVALDVPSAAEARALVERLGPAACFYKIGLELAMSPGYFELVGWLIARGNRVFADLKLFDIPETVARAIANLRGRGISLDRKSTRLNSSHPSISYAVFCLKKKKKNMN